MGRLRFVAKPYPITRARYQELQSLLEAARQQADVATFWVLDRKEQRAQTCRDLKEVARRQGWDLRLELLANSSGFRLFFNHD